MFPFRNTPQNSVITRVYCSSVSNVMWTVRNPIALHTSTLMPFNTSGFALSNMKLNQNETANPQTAQALKVNFVCSNPVGV